MWDLPGPGLEPLSPALAGEFLTTVPPGKSQACNIFEERSADSLIGVPSYVSLCFSLAAFGIITLFLILPFNYDMSSYWSLWVHLVWNSLCFLYLDICFFQEVFSHNFIKHIFYPSLSLFSFWYLYNVNVSAFDVVSEVC